MRINFGCGKAIREHEGWFNIDAERHPKAIRDPELIFQLRFIEGKLVEQIPLDDGCAIEIQAIHVIEHFHRFDVDAVLEEFRRLLAKRGKLVLELPNLKAAAFNLLNGGDKRSSIDAIYGSDKDDGQFMTHLYGYTPESMSRLLADHEFKHIHVMEPQTHGKRLHRDMRFEASK